MSWQELKPLTPAAELAVTVGVRAFRGQQRFALEVTVRRPELLLGLGWWRVGARVSLCRGEGELAGCVRIAPDGPFELGRCGSKGDVARLSTGAFAGLRHAVSPVAARYRLDGTALVVELPDLVRAQASRLGFLGVAAGRAAA